MVFEMSATKKVALMSELLNIRQLAPSLRITGENVTLALSDMSRIIQLITRDVPVNEQWYLNQYADVREAVERGDVESAAAHFSVQGFLEGRLPDEPTVDNAWYFKAYPDVAIAVRKGYFKGAVDHYIRAGIHEGRLPRDPSKESAL